MTTIAPFNEFSTSVHRDWIDDNGHMNVAYYHLVFDLAARPFFNWLGFTEENRKAHNISTFALETHLTYLSEVKVDTIVRVESRLLDTNGKRFHFYQEMFKTESNTLAASHESVGAVVDMQQRKSTTTPEVIEQRLEEIKTAHSQLPRTWQIGHVMAVDAKPAKPNQQSKDG